MVIDPHNGVNPANSNIGNTRNKTASSSASGGIEGGTHNAANGLEKQGQEQVSLSQEAKLLNRLEEKIATAPDIDNDRVAAIKLALENGTYEVNAERIAERILEQDEFLG